MVTIMSYGARLKEILKEKNMSVKELSKKANINQSTLYTIIRRDTSIRYDHAIRIASILDIDVSEICKINPYDVGETLPKLISEFGGLLTQVNKIAMKNIDWILSLIYLTIRTFQKLINYYVIFLLYHMKGEMICSIIFPF